MHALLRRTLVLCTVGTLSFATLAAGAQAATPGVATGVTVKPTSSSATVTWKKAANATSYLACLVEFADQKPCAHQSTQSTATTATFKSLTSRSGTDYFVKIYSYNGSDRAVTALKGFDLKPLPLPAEPASISRTVDASTLTVTWAAAAHAADYSVCLMADTPTSACVKSSPRSKSRTASFTGLAPTPGIDYYYRIIAYNDTGSTKSKSHAFDLPVGAASSLTAAKVAGTARVRVGWEAAVNAGSYELQFATNAAMTGGLTTYTLQGPSATLTKLKVGTTYYYRVRGVNDAVKGAYTKVEKLDLPATSASVSVLTYNLCGQDKCVTTSNGMKKWSTRKAYAGTIARGTLSGIIATQESHDKDTQFGTELPGFGLAAYYSAKSLFYDKAKYDVERSGTITLDSKQKKYAVWAEFRDKVAGAVFIVADAHLQPTKGKANDDLRSAQTTTLINGIKKINTDADPVIYAGDFNSNKSNKQDKYPGGYDAPLKVFTAAGIPDLYTAAGTAKRTNATWNSANQAINPPLKHSDHVDHIFADKSVTVTGWKVVVSISGTRYTTPFATDHNPVRAIVTVPAR